MDLRLSVVLLCLAVRTLFAQSQPLSGEATISVLTCAPGQSELYTAFGHSAIRIQDPQHAIDLAFNYGTFDFNQPHFYLNFARGNLLYELQMTTYSGFMLTYLYQERSVTEQELALTQAQKQRVFDYLIWNALPENKAYSYDYFYDNCATRIRDVFTRVLGDSLRFDSTFVHTRYTIRNLTDLYLSHQPWGDLGIDICLGLPMDKRISPTERMFLPDYVEVFFDSAQVVEAKGSRPLVATKRILFVGDPPPPPWRLWPPWLIFSLALLAIGLISAYDMRREKLSKGLDAILLSTAGFLGVFLLLVWGATDHRAAADNFNLLWALPTHVVVVFMLWRQKWNLILVRYFGFVFLLTVVLLLSWPWLPQQLNTSLLPVVVALGIRYGINYRLRKAASAKHPTDDVPLEGLDQQGGTSRVT